jgi:hypothetical protein
VAGTGGIRNAYKSLVRIPQGKRQLGDIDIDGRLMLIWAVKT